MGDRGNIAVIHSDKSQIWLYSHWGGSDLPASLQEGLQAGVGRYTDESYLTKIIFGHAVPLDNWHKETGVGISGRMQDNEYPVLVVNVPRQCVYLCPEDSVGEDGKIPDSFQPEAVWLFASYCALTDLSYENLAHPEPLIKAANEVQAR